MYVKICGLRDARMAAHSVASGADAVGVVMSERSPRHATHEQATEVISGARRAAAISSRRVDTVLVVNRMPAADAAGIARDLGFDVLQLHGSYALEDFEAARSILPRVWRATSLAKYPGLRAGEMREERLLVDGSTPGSGEVWDLSLLSPASGTKPALGDGWLLAGGLSPANVAATISLTRPWGVDVSSGVECAPGVKDAGLITRFIEAARG